MPLKTLVTDNPYSLRARFIEARTDEKTHVTDDEGIRRSKSYPLDRPASDASSDFWFSLLSHSTRYRMLRSDDWYCSYPSNSAKGLGHQLD